MARLPSKSKPKKVSIEQFESEVVDLEKLVEELATAERERDIALAVEDNAAVQEHIGTVVRRNFNLPENK